MRYTVSLLATAVFVLGVTTASAQNQPTTNVAPPPNSINKGSTTKPSGAEAQPTAHNRAPRVTGNAKFCSETAGGRLLRCRYRSMKTCEKSKAHGNLRCVARPS